MSFMDSDKAPSDIELRDLKPDVNETDAHNMTAQAMTSFIALQTGDEAAREALLALERDTTALLQPLFNAMLFERS